MKIRRSGLKFFLKIKIVIYIFFRWLLSKEGILATILVGLLINALSNNIQDKLQRQRYLELLQLEMRHNYLQARDDMTQFEKTGVIINFTPYRTAVFDSGLQSGYILTLDNKSLSQVFPLYSSYLPKMNQLLMRQQLIINGYSDKWEHCVATITESTVIKCVQDEKVFQSIQKTYSKFIYNGISDLAKILDSIGTAFNPTQDRFKSPLLRLFMGNERLKIQE